MAATRHVYEIYLRTTLARAWAALTRFDTVKRYYYGYGLRTTLRKGAPLQYVNPESGEVAIAGEVLAVVPRRRFVHTFQFQHGKSREPASRVTWELERQGKVVKLTLVHDRLARSPRTARSVRGGWGPILSGLKTLLETGRPLF